MALKTKLALNSQLLFDGDTWTVTGFADTAVRLRSVTGADAVVSLGELAGAPDFKIIGSQDIETPGPSFLDNVPQEAVDAAKEWLAHLNEACTGYRSGSEHTALPNEPRPSYDVDVTTLNQRFENKAGELRIGVRSLWYMKSAYEQQGLYGLIDKRKARISTTSVDARVAQALHEVTQSLIDKSNVSKKRLMQLVRKSLKSTFPDENIPFPSESTFNRFVARATKGEGLFGSAKERRNINNRPKSTYRHFTASRPGEMVAIDATPLDAFALDPVGFKWVQLHLTLAIDIYTRSIVAWRFTPVSVKQVDAALLLYDIIRPKLMQPGWPDAMRWSYIGVPESIVIEDFPETDDAGVAGIPFTHPESVIVDHGKVFISQCFYDACARMGISLQLARPYTPTDKAQVERVFRTIREDFVDRLDGYKGPNIFARGKAPETEAYYFIDEIDAKFAAWVAARYQQRPHDGLFLPGCPLLPVTPNQMYAEALARMGFVHVVAYNNLYYELLPTEWRTIQHYGVELRGLRYDGPILDGYRNQRSEYGGTNAGKWPIRFDPRDYSQVFFYDDLDGTWHPLNWVHAQGIERPFNEATLSYAKALVLSHGGDLKDAEQTAASLNAVLDRMDDGVSAKMKQERRLAGLNAMHAQLAKKDKPNSRTPLPPDEAAEYMLKGATIHSIGDAANKNKPTSAGQPELRSMDEALEDGDDDLDF